MKLEVIQDVQGRLKKMDAGAAFVKRGVTAILRMADELEGEALIQVLGESTDLALVLRALEQCKRVGLTVEEDPLTVARVRGLRLRDKLLSAEGGTLFADDVAKLLHISRQAVVKRRRKGLLVAVNVGRRGDLYPIWQFGEDGLLPGLKDILGLLAEQSDWARLRFFLSENTALDGKRPLDLLRTGALDPVRRAARLTNEHGSV
jgi:hypothetical protein